jgi:hypothetical protein
MWYYNCWETRLISITCVRIRKYIKKMSRDFFFFYEPAGVWRIGWRSNCTQAWVLTCFIRLGLGFRHVNQMYGHCILPPEVVITSPVAFVTSIFINLYRTGRQRFACFLTWLRTWGFLKIYFYFLKFTCCSILK